ncbi:MAG: hypothetical protein ABFD58_13405 [Anaerolineaceae bacterium]|jgi:predicted  nucleic acid-binding Zn-ribbon protein
MDETAAALLAEQLNHAIDLLKADLTSLETQLAHTTSLLEQHLTELEHQTEDHEQRLRAVSDGVTQLKVYSSLLSGSSSILSLAALIKSFFGL